MAVFHETLYGAVVSTPRLIVVTPSLTKNSTWATPLVASIASAVTSMVPETSAPSIGLVMLTDGCVLSTVTLMLWSAVWPTVSVAVAFSVWAPSPAVEVSQGTE